MQGERLDINVGSSENYEASQDTRAVTLERVDDSRIVMRFIYNGEPVWGAKSKQVRITHDLAQQLMVMLADELDWSPV